jgi:hypothetical protein
VKGAASTLATVTQSEALWQVAIAQVPLSAGGLPTSVVDVRRFVNQVMSWRQGGDSTIWDTVGTTNYLVGNVEIMSGSISVSFDGANTSASVTLTFPRVFSQNPLVIANIIGVSGALPVPAVVLRTSLTTSTSQAQFSVQNADGLASGVTRTVRIGWIAIGQRA